MAQKYDAIIIGAGISGCGVAALLSRAGKKVLLLERTKLIGGRASSYKYQGHTLNIGEHAGIQDGYLDTLVQSVGQKIPDRGFFEDYLMWRNGKFEKAFDIVPKLDLEETERVLKIMQEATPEDMEKYDAISGAELFRPLVKNPENWYMINLVGAIWNTIPKIEDQAASSVIEALRTAGRTTLAGFQAAHGIGDYSRTISQVVKECGGEIMTEAPVAEILVENRRVVGVRVEREAKHDVMQDYPIGEVFTVEAPLVVSAIPIWNVLNLISEKMFSPEFVKKAKHLNKLTANLGFMVGLKKPLFTEKIFVMADLPTLGYPTTIFISSNLCPTLSPQGEHLLECSCICEYELGEDRGLVLRKIQEMKDDLEKLYPGWQKKVIWIRPYFRWEEPARTPGRDGIFKPGPKSPEIEGLYFAGDSVNSRTTPGMECAADSAMICTRAILGKLPEVKTSELAAAVKRAVKTKPVKKSPKGKKGSKNSKG
ncbi:MAG: FAD-dependent oxidoreductase [Proteobacteria bacterium]|nr:FAD-dependent oxidoreductase [Pseudomonadota bacterium]